ncbi:MAG: methyltransferase domain-containing protein [Bythopirellula sp.]|nr:methyltransferase domain-containing protein [Bythopirellula sp.]
MKGLSARLPIWLKKPAKQLRNYFKYAGTARYCPVCEKSSSQFLPAGFIRREDAMCPHCGSLERHRLVWLFMNKKTDLFNGKSKKMLHVAPELCLEPKFRKHLGASYLTADLLSPRVMVKMDITDIKYPENSFDVIYCSHVLEHVPDDRKAMREFYRVLKPGGWAILLVPISVDKTYEDPSIVDPDERFKAFGQKDHVRAYGPDYVGRLREAGFQVEVYQVGDLVPSTDVTRLGMTNRSVGEIYYCTK